MKSVAMHQSHPADNRDGNALRTMVERDRVCELDAAVAHLYGLTEKQLVHIFDTFHEGWDYADRLAATLKFSRLGKEIRITLTNH